MAAALEAMVPAVAQDMEAVYAKTKQLTFKLVPDANGSLQMRVI